MISVFGWWDCDKKEETLVNRVSGQRVRRVGPWRLEDDPEAKGWLRFEYRDEEVIYPVLAQLVKEIYVNPLQRYGPHKPPQERPVLHVDHNRSAAVWRQETSAAELYPPYGLWRRVDDCLTDLLPCWPRIKNSDRALGAIVLRGGWLNGAWHEGFMREMPGLTPLMRKEVKNSESELEADRPIVVSLDTAPESPWRFHPFPAEPLPESAPEPEVADGVIRGVKWAHQVRNDLETWANPPYFVPAGQDLKGFEGRTPYMRTEDDHGAIFLNHGTEIGEDVRGEYRMSFSLNFADEFVVGSILAVNHGLLHRDGWTFDLRKSSFVGRNEESRRIYCHEIRGNTAQPPSFALWRQVSRALMDAWLFWEGTAFRNSRWTPSLALVGTEYLIIKGHYVGGVWPAGEYCKTWLEPDAQAHKTDSMESVSGSRG